MKKLRRGPRFYHYAKLWTGSGQDGFQVLYKGEFRKVTRKTYDVAHRNNFRKVPTNNKKYIAAARLVLNMLIITE